MRASERLVALRCTVLVVYGDSEKVRNSSPLPHLASSGEPMSDELDFKRDSMHIETDLNLYSGLWTSINGFHKVDELGSLGV